MQWNARPNAGFSTGEPWLAVAPDHQRHNVEAQQAEPASMLNLYQRLLTLRRSSPALCIGHYTPSFADDRVLTYIREAGDERVLIALNFTDRPVEFAAESKTGSVRLSTHAEIRPEPGERRVSLRPNEGQIIALR
jgi:glycosidase